MSNNGRMTNQPHGLLQCQTCFMATGNERHPETMKTKMSKPKRAKKQRPTLASTFWGHTSNIPPTVLHAFDHWTEAVGKGEFGNTVFPPFGTKPDNPPAKVNVRKRNLCLGKPASLVPGNQVTDPHPLRAIAQCYKNLAMFLLTNPWPALRHVLTDAEFRAWVDFTVAKLDRLEHDQLEHGQVAKRRVFASATPLPPRQKPVDMGTSQLTRVPDTGAIQITGEYVPTFSISGQSVGSITVTGPKVSEYPAREGLNVIASLMVFGLKICQQLARATRLYRVVMSKLRGFKTAFAGFRVNKRDPEIRATRSCVK